VLGTTWDATAGPTVEEPDEAPEGATHAPGPAVLACYGAPLAGDAPRRGFGACHPHLVLAAPQRAGDPLGLGIAPEQRPPAPPDPDPYDRAREDKGYARSLYPEAERRVVDAEIEADGYITIERVREIVTENAPKGSVEQAGLDPELLRMVDAYTDYKVFVAGDNIYTREELYAHYPFHELGVKPEDVFAQQEIAVFPPRQHALQDDLEYIARDADDESIELVALEDMVGAAARRGYQLRRPPLRIVKTKVYVGKQRWDDFLLMQRFIRGAVRVAAAQLAGGGAVTPLVALAAGCGQAPLALADTVTREAELRRREDEARRREEELRRLGEELRRRDEETRRAAAEVQRRLDADLRRIEAMFASVAVARGEDARGWPRDPPQDRWADGARPAPCPEGRADSVAL
jgi:hypothetical protein